MLLWVSGLKFENIDQWWDYDRNFRVVFCTSITYMMCKYILLYIIKKCMCIYEARTQIAIRYTILICVYIYIGFCLPCLPSSFRKHGHTISKAPDTTKGNLQRSSNVLRRGRHVGCLETGWADLDLQNEKGDFQFKNQQKIQRSVDSFSATH